MQKTQTFGNCSHKSLIGEVGLAGSTDILNSSIPLDVTNGVPVGNAVAYYKARIFSFADMLPIEVLMSILYSIVIKSQV